MSRRGRAIAFLLLSLGSAALAAALAEGYGSSVARGYGPLRAVVVLGAPLPAGKPIDPEGVASSLEVHRAPARFVPPGALFAPGEALGLVPDADLPAGTYLVAAQLHPPRRRGAGRRLGRGRRPVEIAAAGAAAVGSKVDVVVTSEPGVGGRARTYIAAAGVPLLALRRGAATLGLRKGQALRLIAAESFARKVTLLPRP